MSSALRLNSPTSFCGLTTLTYTLTVTGMYSVEFNVSIPFVTGTSDNSDTAADSPFASALSCVVNNNGSPVLSVTSPAPTQPFVSGKVSFAGVAGQDVTFVTSSSAAADNKLNAVKGNVNLYQGF